MPDRSPIPLADTVVGGFAAAQSGARWARGAVGQGLYRGLLRLQDMLPARGTRNRRVTPLSARREMQRRAAVALLSLVVVVGGLGAAVFVLGGGKPTGPAIQSFDTAQAALARAEANIKRVVGPGIDLVTTDPRLAEELLAEAYTSLETASRSYPAATINPLRADVTSALDRLYKMVDVRDSTPLPVSRRPGGRPPGGGQGSRWRAVRARCGDEDGLPDRPQEREGERDLPRGQQGRRRDAGRAEAARCRRARPPHGRQRGTSSGAGVPRTAPARAPSPGSGSAAPPSGVPTFRPSGRSSATARRTSTTSTSSTSPRSRSFATPRRRTAAASRPRRRSGWAPPGTSAGSAPCTSTATSGSPTAASSCASSTATRPGWEAADPGDDLLREPPAYRLIGSGADRRTGIIYGFDGESDRLVALSKVNGSYIKQFRLGDGDRAGRTSAASTSSSASSRSPTR